MKRTLYITGIIGMLNGSGLLAQTNVPAQSKEIEAGRILINQFDCKVCHKTDYKVIGPAYRDIAKKYPLTEANILYLSNKIIQGGSGVWGETEMAAHSNLTPDQARKLVVYILSLK